MFQAPKKFGSKERLSQKRPPIAARKCRLVPRKVPRHFALLLPHPVKAIRETQRGISNGPHRAVTNNRRSCGLPGIVCDRSFKFQEVNFSWYGRHRDTEHVPMANRVEKPWSDGNLPKQCQAVIS